MKNISEVFVALGGDRPVLGKARAFHRRGEVLLDDVRGSFHIDGQTGDAITLVETVLAVNHAAATEWLKTLDERL